MNLSRETYCLSCETPFAEGAQFCHVCGQNKRASILSFNELWSNFWSQILSVDNSFFRTLKLIGRPDKLTQMYVAGERKKYLNPIRMFLLMLIFLVATGLLTMKDLGMSKFLDKIHRDYSESLVYEKFDNEIASYPIGNSTRLELEEISDRLFGDINCPDVDTLIGGLVITTGGKRTVILKRDFIELTEEEIYEKYDCNTYWEKLMVGQFLKWNKEPAAATKYLLNNGGWGLIPSILLVCLFLKLLYRNHHIRYLEHLIFVCNVHSLLFFFGICFSLFAKDIARKLCW